MSPEDQRAVAQVLEESGWTVIPPPPPPGSGPRCLVCGLTSEQSPDFDPPLTLVVEVGRPTEDGYARAEKHVCDQHSVRVVDLLAVMGFTTHDHGGLNWLEDVACPGAEDPSACPERSKGETE